MSKQKLSIREYRKLKEDEHTSSLLEEENDPSLQVDYELTLQAPYRVKSALRFNLNFLKKI